ncbi:MAG: competence protein ComEC [Patiriisocius sp.]|jgi:competence protein ComEC
MPFVRLVFALMAGIIFSTFIYTNEIGAFAALVSTSVSLIFIYNSKSKISKKLIAVTGILLYSSVFFLGAFTTVHYMQEDDLTHFSKMTGASYFLTEIIDIPEEKKKSHKTIVNVISYADSLGNWVSCMGKLILYTQKNNALTDLENGDQLLIQNKVIQVLSPSNPGEFNYKRYLSFKYIHHQTYLKTGEYTIQKKSIKSILNLAISIRKKMHKTLSDHGLKDENLAVASALLLGEKGLLDPETHKAYASAGALHVLAVSGLHVGIIYLIFNGLLSLFFKGKNTKKVKTLLIILILWFYAFITGLSPSVVRAATMFSAISIGILMNNKQNIYNTLSSSAFILLIVKPNYLFEVGFQLSYLAVLGIVYLQPKIYNLFFFRNYFMDKIWSLTAVSISAQIATFPLGILYFHIFPSYFLFSNIIVIPAAIIIMYLGITLFTFSFYDPLAGWLSEELIAIIDSLNLFVKWIEKLPNAVIDNLFFSIADTWLLYILIISTTFFLVKRRVKFIFITLASILLLVSFRTLDKISFLDHNYLCVYHISKSSAINLISDEYNYILDVGSLEIDLKNNPFQMKNNWIRHGQGETRKLKIDNLPPEHVTLITENIIGVSGKTIAIVSESSAYTFKNSLNVDYLIMVKHKKLSMSSVLKNYNPKTIIFDSSFSKFYAEKYKSQIPLEIEIHCTILDGGFERRLN